MKISTILITASLVLTIGTASAAGVTYNQTRLGPLFVTSTLSGGLVNVAFSNAFRGALIPWVGTAMMVGQIAKAVKMDYDNGYLDWLIPGKDNTAPTPPGWINPDTPPGTTGLWYTIPFPDGYHYYQTNEEYCAARADYENTYSPRPGSTWSYIPVPGGCNTYLDGEFGGFINTAPNECPIGSTKQGMTCVFSDTSNIQWPSDGVGTYQQDSTGTFKANPRDPDNSTNSPIKDKAEITQKGQDEHGNQVSHTVKTTPDGGLDQIRRLETKDAQGNTIVQEEINHYNNEGSLVQTYNNTYNNTTLNQVEGGTAPTPTEVKLPQITVSGNGGVLNKTLPQTETAADATTRLKVHISNNTLIAPLLNVPSASGACPLHLSVNLASFGSHQTNVMCDLYELMIPTLDVLTKFAFALTAILIFFSA